MRQLLIMVVLVFTCGFASADDQRTGRSLSLHIRTVDENNNAFKVETVRWWHTGKPGNIHQLECTTGPCSEWVLEEDISGSIVIHAATSIVTKDDAHCWDVYAGNLVVDMPTREATITIAYANMVCKSQQASRS